MKRVDTDSGDLTAARRSTTFSLNDAIESSKSGFFSDLFGKSKPPKNSKLSSLIDRYETQQRQKYIKATQAEKKYGSKIHRLGLDD